MIKKTKGFTLIELLVVIAIIGILSSVVLASLNSARAKGVDAAIKSNLDTVRDQSEIVYDNAVPNSYATVCADGTVSKAVAAAAAAGGYTVGVTDALETTTTVVCQDTVASWAVQSPIKAGGYWCVDSTGKAQAEPAVLAANSFLCV